jgi:hypothetical protein
MKTDKKFEGNKGNEISEADENILPPTTYIDIDNIITNLKVKKAPGTDNIPSELIKHGGSTLKQRLYNLILLIRKKEELPKDWTEGIICPIYIRKETVQNAQTIGQYPFLI